MNNLQAEFGRYVFLKKLAEGGMAEIYLAQRRSFGGFGRLVVLKRLLEEHRGHRTYEKLFLEEARILSSMGHSNIVDAYDLGKFEDAYFIVMEYIHGVSGAQLLTKSVRTHGFMPYGPAMRVIGEIAFALHHGFHAPGLDGTPKGVIHHDVSPHNLQIGFDGTVKLLDYGVATILGEDAALGRRGKYAYMTPEAVNKDPADHRSDLFSLGIGLYEFTVGKRLFKASSPSETMQRIKNGRVPPPKTFRPDFPEPLAQILERLLDVRPEARYQTGEDLAQALKAAAQTMGVQMGREHLVEYIHELFQEEIETRRVELKGLVDRVESAEEQEWTSIHLVSTSAPGEITDESTSTDEHQIPAPSGRETMELDAFLSQNSTSYPPVAIERPELGPMGDTLSGDAILSTLPPGVNDQDPDWSMEHIDAQLESKERTIRLLRWGLVALAAGLCVLLNFL